MLAISIQTQTKKQLYEYTYYAIHCTQLARSGALPFPFCTEAHYGLFLQGDKGEREDHLNTAQLEFLTGNIKREAKFLLITL